MTETKHFLSRTPQYPRLYDVKEFEALAPHFINLVEKLKTDLEKAEFDVIISDEAGGRIPTLVLLHILRKLHPYKYFRTMFISLGKKIVLQSDVSIALIYTYLMNKKITLSNFLVSTEYIHDGSVMKILVEALKICDPRSILISSLFAKEQEYTRIENDPTVKLYIGTVQNSHTFVDYHEIISGITRNKDATYQFTPLLVEKYFTSTQEASHVSKLIRLSRLQCRSDCKASAEYVFKKIWQVDQD